MGNNNSNSGFLPILHTKIRHYKTKRGVNSHLNYWDGYHNYYYRRTEIKIKLTAHHGTRAHDAISLDNFRPTGCNNGALQFWQWPEFAGPIIIVIYTCLIIDTGVSNKKSDTIFTTSYTTRTVRQWSTAVLGILILFVNMIDTWRESPRNNVLFVFHVVRRFRNVSGQFLRWHVPQYSSNASSYDHLTFFIYLTGERLDSTWC